MEPRRRAPDASLALPSEPSPPKPKPPRLLSGDALRARLDADPGPREIETILVDAEGISSRRGPSPLELALADAPESGGVAPMAIESRDEAFEDVENFVGDRDASPRPRPVAVPLRVVAVRRLCDGPLDLVSLGDAFLARGHRESWVVRDALGTQRVSVDLADAPEMSAACAMPANPNVALAVVRGRLAVVRPDLEHRDPARRAPIADPAVVDELVEGDERVTFLCGDDATGRVVATTERGVARDWRTYEWGCLPNEGSRAPWSLVSWKRAADSDADHAGYADVASSDVHVASSNAEADFSAISGSSVVSNAGFYRVTALASCETPAEVDGGVLAVGTSNPTPFARFRRMEGGGDREDDLEGHVFLMHLADEDEAVDAEPDPEVPEEIGMDEPEDRKPGEPCCAGEWRIACATAFLRASSGLASLSRKVMKELRKSLGAKGTPAWRLSTALTASVQRRASSGLVWSTAAAPPRPPPSTKTYGSAPKLWRCARATRPSTSSSRPPSRA